MFSNDLSKVSCVEIATNVLNQALQHLHEHNYASAQVAVAVARQMLEDLQLDFDRHFQIQTRLKYLLTPASAKDCSLTCREEAGFMSNRSILLIEHEPSIREVLYICLSEFNGWRVTLSRTIQEGVDLCIAERPDVILLDTATSETDALLFVEQLKQHSMTQSIPILLITARASWFNLRQLNQMGFAGAIAKPFNPATLSTQVSCLLGWSSGE